MDLPFDIQFTPISFLTFWIITMVFILTTLFIMGSIALRVFPDINEVNVKFREKWASGNSNDQLIHKLGGASKILEVIITKDELWVKAPALFAGYMNKFGLLRKIKLAHIYNIKIEKKSIVLNFKNIDGSISEMNLLLKEKQKFIDVITDTNPELYVINKA